MKVEENKLLKRLIIAFLKNLTKNQQINSKCLKENKDRYEKEKIGI